jgi:hypothetical protein
MLEAFPRYTEFDPVADVWCVTPHEGRTIHRFFDTSPFSPSGRYMALFRLPQEQRLPEPGEAGQVVLVDLEAGEERVVAETRGWEPQMGANVQWGADDRTILFNDVDTATWQPTGVALDPFTGQTRRIAHGVYKASPDGQKVACASLAAMRRTQNGYGVVVPDEFVPRNVGLREDDGLYVSDVATGSGGLLISIAECVRRAEPPSVFRNLDGYEVYGFHCKWNPQDTRLLFTLRGYPADHPARFDALGQGVVRFEVLTLDGDARDVRLAVGADQWAKGGHHINWFPDGEHLSMNLNIDRKGLRFCRVRYDGTGLGKILDDVPGSGHPTVHPNGRHILTDAYVHEPVTAADGTVPLRLVDLHTGRQQTVVRMRTLTEPQDSCGALRVDPHPAWDAAHRLVAFNGFADGTRRVYVADLSPWVG